MTLKLKIENDRPFFAELPYYLWGEVNYDSDGDCQNPTDTHWNYFYLSNRENSDTVEIDGQAPDFIIKSDNKEIVWKTALFLKERCGAELTEIDKTSELNNWNHQEAYARTKKIKADFENHKLKPFDDTVFWGSWKWTGKFATQFTWIGRWIMNSIIENDTRAVNLCAYWLKEGTFNETQSKALRYALHHLTQENFKTDKEWVQWYYGKTKLLKGRGEKLYPEPDFDEWQKEK